MEKAPNSKKEAAPPQMIKRLFAKNNNPFLPAMDLPASHGYRMANKGNHPIRKIVDVKLMGAVPHAFGLTYGAETHRLKWQ